MNRKYTIKDLGIDAAELEKACNGELELLGKNDDKTKNMVRVRIPLETYLTIELQCDDLKTALLNAINMNSNLGILNLEGGYLDHIEEYYEGTTVQRIPK